MAYEQPRYDVTQRFPGFELRDYSPCVVAETDVEASHAGAGKTERRSGCRPVGGSVSSPEARSQRGSVRQFPAVSPPTRSSDGSAHEQRFEACSCCVRDGPGLPGWSAMHPRRSLR